MASFMGAPCLERVVISGTGTPQADPDASGPAVANRSEWFSLFGLFGGLRVGGTRLPFLSGVTSVDPGTFGRLYLQGFPAIVACLPTPAG